MSESEPRRENIDQKPFVIRGHHLRMYIPLIKDDPPYRKGVPTPAQDARGMRRFMEAIPSMLILKPDGSSWEDIVPDFLKYSQDCIGTTTESANRYEERLKEAFERFVSLPDDYPAELIEEMPDSMCDACAVGEHCRSRNFASRIPWSDMSSRESEYLDEFLKNLNLLNLPKPVINYEQAYFPDADPEQVRRVKTTLGVIRKVLKETRIEMWF